MNTPLHGGIEHVFLNLCLAALDIVCTCIGLKLGLVYEANPLMAMLFQWSMLGTCLIVAAVNGFGLWFIARYGQKWAKTALTLIASVKVFIVMAHAL